MDETQTRYQVPHTVQHTMKKWETCNLFKTSYYKMSEKNVSVVSKIKRMQQ